MRNCKKCGFNKPISEFYDKFHQCKPCVLAMRREKSATDPDYRERARRRAASWAKANPERYKENQRRAHLRRAFGITPEDYEQMLQNQQGKCKVCGATESGFENRPALHVDHNHMTNEIRALLCNGCNAALGMVGDSPERLEALAQYLRAYV